MPRKKPGPAAPAAPAPAKAPARRRATPKPKGDVVVVSGYSRARRLPTPLRRHSSLIPKEWLDSYTASIDSGEVQLSLRDEIALVDAMVGELLETLGGLLGKRLDDSQAAQAALARQSLMGLIEQRRKLVETEQKHSHMLAAEVVQGILRRTVDVLGSHVADRAILQAVARDLRGVLAEFRLSTASMLAGED